MIYFWLNRMLWAGESQWPATKSNFRFADFKSRVSNSRRLLSLTKMQALDMIGKLPFYL
jgi:hypothetical protein